MVDYCIGIIDEDPSEIDYVKRTILINKPDSVEEQQIAFKVYSLDHNTANLSRQVSVEAIDDISSGEITALIIDYQIIISTTLIEGTEIFKSILSIVREFPVVMLTNLPDTCYDKPFVDADKIYLKRQFFKIEEVYSKEKTQNLFRNMDHYKYQRASFSAQLAEQLAKLETDGGYSVATLQAIVEAENLLDAFCPQQQTTVEKSLKISDLRDAVELIQKANNMLGEYDEN